MRIFNVGDRVSWCGKKGIVLRLGSYDEADIIVRFGPNDTRVFTFDGKLREDRKVPSLVKLKEEDEK